MKFVTYGLIYVVLLLFQLTFANLLSIYDVKPDFILIFLVYLSLNYGRLWGGVIGFFMGIIEDSFNTILFGLNALTKAFVGFFVFIIPWRVTGTSTTDVGFILFVAAIVNNFLYNWIYSFGSGVNILFIFFRYALPAAIYTAVIGMMINAILPGYLKIQNE